MPGIYYAAVEDDPLTSGEDSRVYASKQCGTIKGPDGTCRRMAFIGDEAYCPKCGSVGVIAYGAGVNEKRRLVDMVNGGRRQAVGDDIVLCKCADHPRIIATYGRRWIIRDGGEETRVPVAKAPLQSPIHDERFTLIDAAGRPLSEVWYTIRMPSGELLHGVTDSSGKTGRYKTDGAQRLAVYLGHREV